MSRDIEGRDPRQNLRHQPNKLVIGVDLGQGRRAREVL